MDVIFDTLATQGRSQQWLARQLGIHRSLLTHYKAGRRQMPEALVRRSAELLGLPVSIVHQHATVFPVGDDEREVA